MGGRGGGGDMVVYDIAVILILMCGVAVSSSPAGVCGLSSFLLTVFGRRGSFTVLPAVPFICMHSPVD